MRLRVKQAGKGIVGTIFFAFICTAAHAQWSTGAPGDRLPARGEQRYSFMVFANPLPGREEEFNDWYLNRHLGDLVQLQGWKGAQRFRQVPDVLPESARVGFAKYNHVVLWDLEGGTSASLTSPVRAAISGGKIRRGAAFDYAPGASPYVTYKVAGPRITRPDGVGPFNPSASDDHTHRPNRYILMEFSAPHSPDQDAQFQASIDKRIQSVLQLPGWLAAQRLTVEAQAAPRRQYSIPSETYLTIWEIQAESAQAAEDELNKAENAGSVPNPRDKAGGYQASWWEPISPYITKEDFQR
ncbi:hypothetical protein [Paraburkholderia sp. BL27I4N3]|uniref:hypothetical protein n=1 Tax=Paraburkholderia sp. BL27I4N3 TaxID=1938805 RepID=UPI0011C02621|nr:hypothetical protein [Paraburkholderia sp. BL27I4N3]